MASQSQSLPDRLARWADGNGPAGVGEHLLAAGLRLASLPYAAAAAARSSAYDSGVLASHGVDRPVLSVGNLSAGGTGKTPLVIYLAQALGRQGLRVAIVSRGYRRSGGEDALQLVSNREGVLLTPDVAGDEPWLMARRLPGVPVVVAADRLRAARHAIETCDPQVILLDDGFQHRRLRRTCDIVLWDALRPARAAALLPRGLLRESLGALRRAHAVVLTRCNLTEHSTRPIKRRIKRIAPHVLLFESGLLPSALVDRQGNRTAFTPGALANSLIGAFCALGNPGSFWRLLESAGAQIVWRRALPDHYRPRPEEVEQLWRQARNKGAQRLLVTEKDLANLPRDTPDDIPIVALAAEPTFWNDTDRFHRFIMEAALA